MITLKGATAAGINECGAPGVTLDVELHRPRARRGVPGDGVRGIRTHRRHGHHDEHHERDGDRVGVGHPAITLAQDGITVWHTNGPTDLVVTAVELAPGEAMEFPASFEPVRCEPEDEIGEAFRSDLPPAGAGSYEISAALDFSSDQVTATTEAFLVTGPGMPSRSNSGLEEQKRIAPTPL